ncbi:MAG: hypothetical protein WCX79_01035 [Candidatus Paceibacterota bacterium]|jgi:hypothetical protein
MRDLFKDDDEIQDDYNADPEQPQITDGGEEEQPQDNGMYDDGTGTIPNNDISMISKDFKYIDRFVTVKGMPGPARNTNEESNFILNDSFAEQLVINFLSDADQRKIWRNLCDIIDESEGSGNAKVAQSDAKLLASRILMKRSSTENALSLNERAAHITQVNKSNITTKTNQIRPASSGGWLSRLFGH